MLDADAVLSAARRPLVLGIGGGGDVVGALATAAGVRRLHGAQPVVGGVSWERRPIDPRPGPRTEAEIMGARRLAPGVLAAGPGTRVREGGVRFAESRMAEHLGEEVVLVDPTGGPAALAAALRQAAARLDSDLVVLIDVGGDALAHGHEPGLASPLCDSLLMAAGALLERAGVPVLGGVFGIGCDGELTPEEVLERIAEIASAGGLAGQRGIGPQVAAELEAAVAVVPTEASAQAVRCFRGLTGAAPIRGGRRTVPLSPVGAGTVYFEVGVAVDSAARLARAVLEAGSLEHANDLLHDLGVRTELDIERDAAAAAPAP